MAYVGEYVGQWVGEWLGFALNPGAMYANLSGYGGLVADLVGERGGGDTSGGKRKRKIAVEINGRRRNMTPHQLAEYLNKLKTEAEPERIIQKSAPPKVRVKVVDKAPEAQEAVEEIRQEVDRVNQILELMWRMAMIRRAEEMDDEETLVMLL